MHRDKEPRRTRIRRALRVLGRRTASLVSRWTAAASSPLLDAAGLGLIAWAASMLAVPAGVAAAGVACLIMSKRLSR